MNRKTQRRLIMFAFFLGGPIVGWLLKGDRGLLFGLAVSFLAAIWFAIEERKLL